MRKIDKLVDKIVKFYEEQGAITGEGNYCFPAHSIEIYEVKNLVLSREETEYFVESLSNIEMIISREKDPHRHFVRCYIYTKGMEERQTISVGV